MGSMHVAIWNNYECFAANEIFNQSAYPLGEDLGYPLALLRDRLARVGAEMDTLDLYPVDEFDKYIFIDVPRANWIQIDQLSKLGKDLYLILTEVEIVYPRNMRKKEHRHFSKVFTYRDDLVDGRKYFKYYLPNKLPRTLASYCRLLKRKLCTLIASNKANSDRRELYSERRKTIRWFESNCPDEFDLYGVGWDEFHFHGPRLVRALNRLGFLRKLLRPYYPSYRGSVSSKRAILSQYKFCVCYENAREIPGYITEKIFDCFAAGCVPIYWGAPNVTDLIPADAFIDRRHFRCNSELYRFLKSISNARYLDYVDNIAAFLGSERARFFSAEHFVETIMKGTGLQPAGL